MFGIQILVQVACVSCHGTKSPLFTFFSSSSLCFTYFSPRRGYRRVTKYCIGSQIVTPTPPIHVHRYISAGVDGGLSRGSSVRRPGSKDPSSAPAESVFKMSRNLIPHMIHVYFKFKHQNIVLCHPKGIYYR
jgi:hypothetical protein